MKADDQVTAESPPEMVNMEEYKSVKTIQNDAGSNQKKMSTNVNLSGTMTVVFETTS